MTQKDWDNVVVNMTQKDWDNVIMREPHDELDTVVKLIEWIDAQLDVLERCQNINALPKEPTDHARQCVRLACKAADALGIVHTVCSPADAITWQDQWHALYNLKRAALATTPPELTKSEIGKLLNRTTDHVGRLLKRGEITPTKAGVESYRAAKLRSPVTVKSTPARRKARKNISDLLNRQDD